MTDTADQRSTNATAWSLFAASALFAVFASLINSFVLIVFSGILFALSIIWVSIYYGQRKKLGYASIVIGIVGILLIFANHLFYGFAIVAWGLVLSIIDAIQNRRWIILSFVAVMALIPVVMVGTCFSAMRSQHAIAAAAMAPATTSPEPEAATTPATTSLEPEAATSSLASREPPSPVASVVANATQPSEATQTFAEVARPVAMPATSERIVTAHVYIDRTQGLYHTTNCPAANPKTMMLGIEQAATLLGWAPHSCVIEARKAAQH